MQDEVTEKVDYDELAINPLLAEIEVGVAGDNTDAKNKQRRYWTPKEEVLFYEIWGRDNWRLTKHGKNTVFFAQWAEEMKKRHNVDIRPEEVQAKVNQTRAKFRSVKKQANFDKHNPRWKKFDTIDKILKNKYRPDDAEPIPPDFLRKNRDISPDTDEGTDEVHVNTKQPPTPTSLTSSSQDTNTTQQQQTVILSTDQHIELTTSTLTEHDVTANLFNASDLQPNPDYGTQLYGEVKQEFPTDYHQTSYPTQYPTEQNHFPSGLNDEPPQLLELQTPQQQMQQHQYNNVVSTTVAYEQHHSAPTDATFAAPPNAEVVNLFNNQTHYSTPTVAPQQTYNNIAQPYTNNNYTNTNNSSTNNNTNNNSSNSNNNNNSTNNGVMQPPRPAIQTITPRKRGRQSTNHALVPSTASTGSEPSLESMYLDEVRKKNAILDEQREIARKRLHIEERKVALMEQFFPKCLELQTKILDKLQFNSNFNKPGTPSLLQQ